MKLTTWTPAFPHCFALLTSIDIIPVNTRAAGAATTSKYTKITDTYGSIWNINNPKEQTVFVKASQPDTGWERLDVGIPNSTILMDMLGDRASLFGWDPLLHVSTEGTDKIVANAKTLTWGTRVFDAGITKQDQLLENYIAVSTDKCQAFDQWYNGKDRAKITDVREPDYKKRLIQAINPNNTNNNKSLTNL